MLRFFREAVFQPRFPRGVAEGAVKGFMLGATILSQLDLLLPNPTSSSELYSHSTMITNGYLGFIALGAFCGLVGKYCLNDPPQALPAPQVPQGAVLRA